MNWLTRSVSFVVITSLLPVSIAFSVAPEPDESLNAEAIAAASGAKTTVTPDGVVRIGWARDDVKVQVDGVRMKPFAGLGS
jgi:hypothetical protein